LEIKERARTQTRNALDAALLELKMPETNDRNII